MYVASSILSGFRSYKNEKLFRFDPLCTIIVGPNAVGKTNILEGLHTGLTCAGFREKKVDELINLSETNASISIELKEKKATTQLEAQLHKKNDLVYKLFFVNELRKTMHEYKERTLPVVLFQPSDLNLITGTPDKRRNLIDAILCRVNPSYLLAKNQYERGLYKRNKILEVWHTKSRLQLDALLDPWDNLLVLAGNKLQEIRNKLVLTFNKNPEFDGMLFTLEYAKNNISTDIFLNAREYELRTGRTSCGPQLDDFLLKARHSNQKNTMQLSNYGARSEQRMGVLWLKVNEMRFFEQEMNKKPILLMDDIFSELDHENSIKILKLTNNYQSVITTSHKDVLPQLTNPYSVIELV